METKDVKSKLKIVFGGGGIVVATCIFSDLLLSAS